MSGRQPAIKTSHVERELSERIAAAKIRLRFDKSVLRLTNGLKAALEDVVADGEAIIFTVAAPIKRRAQTAAALESLVRAGLPAGEARKTIHDNQIRLLRLTGVPAHMPKVVGFVYNRDADAAIILALVQSRLLGHD